MNIKNSSFIDKITCGLLLGSKLQLANHGLPPWSFVFFHDLKQTLCPSKNKEPRLLDVVHFDRLIHLVEVHLYRAFLSQLKIRQLIM